MREDRTPGGRHRHKSLQDHRPKKQRAREEPTTNGTVANGDDHTDSSAGRQPDTPVNQREVMAFIDMIRERATDMPDIAGHTVKGEDGNSQDVKKLMQLAYQELYQVIQWAKDVPGFKDVELEDQVTLIKACFMDLIVFRLAYRSVPCDPMSLRFGQNLILEKHEVTDLGWTEDLVDTNLEFTDKLRSLNLDPNEFSCMCALVLLCPGM